MRDICGKMECNQKLINTLGSRYHRVNIIRKDWENIDSYEQANEKLSKVTFESIIEKIGLNNTAYYLPEVCKSYAYHSIASNVSDIIYNVFVQMRINKFIETHIIDVKEKKLGYNRANTIKVTLKDNTSEVLCYIEAKTEVCEVPKKQSNSTGKGLRIVSFEMSRPDVSIAELLEEKGIKNRVISEWIRETIFKEINDCMYEIRSASDATVEQAKDVCSSIKCNAKRISELADKYVKEMEKIL